MLPGKNTLTIKSSYTVKYNIQYLLYIPVKCYLEIFAQKQKPFCTVNYNVFLKIDTKYI